MAKGIKPADLSAAIEEQLTVYHEGIIQRMNAASEAAVKKLVKLTKATAPVGYRGKFKRSITSGVKNATKRGNTYAWYVKPPEHRLVHLLVRSHATKDGGRTKADPFLKNAVDIVLPDYEKSVEEAIKG
jgi:hypothetical protein